MATLVERIEKDIASLDLYFERLFGVLDEVTNVPEASSREPRITRSPDPQSYVAFVKPDMLANVYSLVDFWLNQLCEAASQARVLSLTHKEIRGKNALDARHKFLTKVAGLKLAPVDDSLEHLDIVRDARNCLLHAGGHASERLARRLSSVSGVDTTAGLLLIDKSFIVDSLEHARVYLSTIAKNLDDQ